MKPEILAVRAINQYRKRDVLAYISLRYYLDNICAVRDIWIKDVATHLVNSCDIPIYFRSYNFKEITNNDGPIHRKIYLPGPNETLAETALLYECSKEPAFQSRNCVYSYRFPDSSSKEGIFRNYFPGFQSRNSSIAKVCNDYNDKSLIVRYTDIKKFYPSISYELALKAWKETCAKANLDSIFNEIGERILYYYNRDSKNNNEGSGLLTGPMFSHLIANLILTGVDKLMFEHMEGKYWRYVDDFVLVGSSEQVENGRILLKSILNDMGLSLHNEGKDFDVESMHWLQETFESGSVKSKNWASLIANIKRFLLVNSKQTSALKKAFLNEGISIPLLDYSNVVAESSYRENFLSWLKRYSWAARSLHRLTVENLVREALQTKIIYQQEIKFLLNQNADIGTYKRKQLITKLRFYSKRLTLLMSPAELPYLRVELSKYPELCLQANVMEAIYTKDVSLLIKLGGNVVQSAAQIIRIHNKQVTCSLNSFNEVELQGLAILRINGIRIDFTEGFDGRNTLDSLNKFTLNVNPLELMKDENPFIKQVACLRGASSLCRHEFMLSTAFDEEEQLSFDIIDQLQASSYF